MSYRSHFEMAMDILKASVEPIRKTRLMYATNINCVVLSRRIDDLIERGLMKKSRLKMKAGYGNKKLSDNPTLSKFYEFQVTDEGLELVDLYLKLKSLWRKTK